MPTAATLEEAALDTWRHELNATLKLLGQAEATRGEAGYYFRKKWSPQGAAARIEFNRADGRRVAGTEGSAAP